MVTKPTNLNIPNNDVNDSTNQEVNLVIVTLVSLSKNGRYVYLVL